DVVRSQLALDRAFTNASAVDPTKDFQPLGPRPAVGDTLFLASEEAFSRPGAAVTLAVDPATPGPAPAVATLVWEFWSGATGRWEELTVADTSSALTASGTVTFTVPAELSPVELNGELRRFVRVRVSSGSYGVDAHYEPVVDGDVLRGFRLV